MGARCPKPTREGRCEGGDPLGRGGTSSRQRKRAGSRQRESAKRRREQPGLVMVGGRGGRGGHTPGNGGQPQPNGGRPKRCLLERSARAAQSQLVILHDTNVCDQSGSRVPSSTRTSSPWATSSPSTYGCRLNSRTPSGSAISKSSSPSRAPASTISGSGSDSSRVSHSARSERRTS